MKPLEQPGIYGIWCRASGMYYIGSTVNVSLRFQEHVSYLRGNFGLPNRHIQNAWNKYGEKAFLFFVLEYCRYDQRIQREAAWMLAYICRGDKLYNTFLPTEWPTGRHKKTTEQRKKLISASKKHRKRRKRGTLR